VIIVLKRQILPPILWSSSLSSPFGTTIKQFLRNSTNKKFCNNLQIIFNNLLSNTSMHSVVLTNHTSINAFNNVVKSVAGILQLRVHSQALFSSYLSQYIGAVEWENSCYTT
jgi:hypothetical protein